MGLLAELERFADETVAADLPSDPRAALGALIFAIEQSGWQLDLTPPTPVPDREEVQAGSEKDAEIDRLRAQLAEAESAKAAPDAAPVAPAPALAGTQPPPSEPPAVTG
jgi:hypothetical protein